MIAVAPTPLPTGGSSRPTYHYAAAANWLSDPNGLVYADGEWHLFYQYNPHGDLWGHMAWGHAVSDDLFRWRELPPALVEDERHAIYSGSAVVDENDSAGFGAGAMVAIYTGARAGGGHQSQCLAASTDRGRSWTKFAGNPVLDRDSADFRDPNVFWHAGTGRWIMVVALSAENRALVYASDDLTAWREQSSIGPFALPGHVWECPLLIELPIAGTDKTRWLFKVDLLHDGPGSGAVALTGTFDGERFVADRAIGGDAPEWLVVDHGRDFYAAVAWHAPRNDRGRPCWIGWMGNHAYQAALPSRGWRGSMSVPRRIGLVERDGGYRLTQTVEPAVDEAFDTVAPLSGDGTTRDIPIAARIAVTRRAARRGRIVIADADGTSVTVALLEDGVVVARASSIHPVFDAPIHAGPADTHITLWLDVGTLEIASSDGTMWLGIQHCLSGDTMTLSVEADGPVEATIAVPRTVAA